MTCREFAIVGGLEVCWEVWELEAQCWMLLFVYL